MKPNNHQQFFKKITLIALTGLLTLSAKAQSNIDRIKDLYNMLQNAKQADMGSPHWTETKRTYLSGDCQNGYGILMVYGTQQEGYFRNGQLVKGVVTNQGSIVAQDNEIIITRQSGLDKLSNMYGMGYTLKEINFFQDLVYKNLPKVTALVQVKDRSTYYTTTTFENHKLVGYDPQWRTTTTFYKTDGLRNTSDKAILVRRYSKKRSKLSSAELIHFDYTDESVIVWPGADIEWSDMAVNPPPDNGQNISAEKLQYQMTREEAFKQGYGEYTRYVGEYSVPEKIAYLTSAANLQRQKMEALNNKPAPAPTPAAPETGDVKTIMIDSYTRKTNIDVKKGDKVNIEASGLIVLGPFVGSGGPNGVNGYERYRIIPSARHGALVYRIGNDNWDIAGTQASFTAQSSGNLQFMVNDSDPSNNRGSFTVKVEVISPK